VSKTENQNSFISNCFTSYGKQLGKVDNPANGARVGGAARGAAGGAVIGAIAGDAGTGAAIGAAPGPCEAEPKNAEARRQPRSNKNKLQPMLNRVLAKGHAEDRSFKTPIPRACKGAGTPRNSSSVVAPS
jgi:hypothetical protein